MRYQRLYKLFYFLTSEVITCRDYIWCQKQTPGCRIEARMTVTASCSTNSLLTVGLNTFKIICWYYGLLHLLPGSTKAQTTSLLIFKGFSKIINKYQGMVCTSMVLVPKSCPWFKRAEGYTHEISWMQASHNGGPLTQSQGNRSTHQTICLQT